MKVNLLHFYLAFRKYAYFNCTKSGSCSVHLATSDFGVIGNLFFVSGFMMAKHYSIVIIDNVIVVRSYTSKKLPKTQFMHYGPHC